jgi:capsid portal protein
MTTGNEGKPRTVKPMTEEEAEAAREELRAEQVEKAGEKEREVSPIRVLMAKARAMAGISISDQQALEAISDEAVAWKENQAVDAPYDPESMLSFVEITPHLQPCIDSYCQNIDGFGHYSDVVEPWMKNLDSEEARIAVKASLEIENWLTARDATTEIRRKKPEAEAQEPVEVTEELVGETLAMLKDEIRREQYLFDAWFRNCVSSSSFVQLRKKVREDRESHGWGCVEMLRDVTGYPRRLCYVPAYTVRPIVDSGVDNVKVTELDKVTPLSKGNEIIITRRFRRYVQNVNGEWRYFRTIGDPRVISNLTGKIYTEEGDKDAKQGLARMKKDEPDAVQANELWWMARHSARTPCPGPRWQGNLLQVLGGREADEMNYAFFKNGTIPPGFLFVDGGGLATGAGERVKSMLRDAMRGAGSKNRIIVLEAKTEGAAAIDSANRQPLPKITYQSCRADQQNDQVFGEYDQRNGDRIGSSFRLSPVLRGQTPSDLNRATAFAALFQAEQQVFAPEREEFDWSMNKFIMPEIGIKYLKFASNPPLTRTPDDIIAAINADRDTALLPNEKRQALADVLGIDLPEIQEDWAKKQPAAYTLAGLGQQGGFGGYGGGGTQGAPEEVAPMALLAKMRRLESLVEALTTGDAQAAALAAEYAKRFEADEGGGTPP